MLASASIQEDSRLIHSDPAGSLLIIGTIAVCSGLILLVFKRLEFAKVLQEDNVPWYDTSKGRISKYPSLCYWFEIIFNTEDARALFIDRVKVTAVTNGFHYSFLSSEYLSRLTFVTIFFAIASYLNALSAVIAGWRTPNIRVMDTSGEKELPTRILPDLGHDILHLIEGYFGKDSTQLLDPDFFLVLLVNSTFLFIVCHPKRLLILRRVFAIFGYCNLLRAICVITTSLPDSAPRCTAQFGSESGKYKDGPIFPKAYTRAIRLLISPSEVVSCGDMIFSGHTVALALCFFVFQTYCTMEECNTPLVRLAPDYFCKALRMLVTINVCLGLFAILGTKLHYTLDILIALYVSHHAWSIYHRVAVDAMHNPGLHGISAAGFDRMFRWLEAEEIQYVDNNAYSDSINSTERKVYPKKNGYTPVTKIKRKEIKTTSKEKPSKRKNAAKK